MNPGGSAEGVSQQIPDVKTVKKPVEGERVTANEKKGWSERVKKNFKVAKNWIVDRVNGLMSLPDSPKKLEKADEAIHEIAAMPPVSTAEAPAEAVGADDENKNTAQQKAEETSGSRVKPEEKKSREWTSGFIGKVGRNRMTNAVLGAGALLTVGVSSAKEASAFSQTVNPGFDQYVKDSNPGGLSFKSENPEGQSVEGDQSKAYRINLQNIDDGSQSKIKTEAVPRIETYKDFEDAAKAAQQELRITPLFESGRQQLQKGLEYVTGDLGTAGTVVKAIGTGLLSVAVSGAGGRITEEMRPHLREAMHNAGVSDPNLFALDDRNPHNMGFSHTFELDDKKGSITFGANPYGDKQGFAVQFSKTW